MVVVMSSDDEIEVKVVYVENVEKDTVQDVLYHHLEEKFYQRTYRNLCLKYYPELEQPSPLEGDHEGIQLPTHTVISDEFASETERYNDFLWHEVWPELTNAQKHKPNWSSAGKKSTTRFAQQRRAAQRLTLARGKHFGSANRSSWTRTGPSLRGVAGNSL